MSLDGKQNCSELNGSNMPINLHKICQFHFDLSLSFLSMPVIQRIYHSFDITRPCHFVAPACTVYLAAFTARPSSSFLT